MRRAARLPSGLLASVVIVAACVAPSSPPPAGTGPGGFPTGVWAKTYLDPFHGPMRLSWVFEPDGDWAEVPEATAGQTLQTGPARGRYIVDGDLVTLEVDSPVVWGWTRHRWRLDGDRLATTFDDSELPSDRDFFELLDRQPWVRPS